MATYWRIQPAGLDLSHFSEDSEGEATCLHVYTSQQDVIHCAEGNSEGSGLNGSRLYGDEVVEIEGGESWENGDVEGVAINPATARITKRFSADEFCRKMMDSVDADYDEDDDLWSQARDFDYDGVEL